MIVIKCTWMGRLIPIYRLSLSLLVSIQRVCSNLNSLTFRHFYEAPIKVPQGRRRQWGVSSLATDVKIRFIFRNIESAENLEMHHFPSRTTKTVTHLLEMNSWRRRTTCIHIANSLTARQFGLHIQICAFDIHSNPKMFLFLQVNSLLFSAALCWMNILRINVDWVAYLGLRTPVHSPIKCRQKAIVFN